MKTGRTPFASLVTILAQHALAQPLLIVLLVCHLTTGRSTQVTLVRVTLATSMMDQAFLAWPATTLVSNVLALAPLTV